MAVLPEIVGGLEAVVGGAEFSKSNAALYKLGLHVWCLQGQKYLLLISI